MDKVVGDFKRLDKYSNGECTEWLDSKESIIISHWHMDGCAEIIDVLLNVKFKENSFTYTSEINCGSLVHYYYREDSNGVVGREGINIIFKRKTSLDNVNLDIGCSLDRFIKQVIKLN